MTLQVEVVTNGSCTESAAKAALEAMAAWITGTYIPDHVDDADALCLDLEIGAMRSFLLAAIAAYLVDHGSGLSLNADELSGSGVTIELSTADAVSSVGTIETWDVGGFSWPASGVEEGCELYLSIRCCSECDYVEGLSTPLANRPANATGIALFFSLSRTNIVAVEGSTERLGTFFRVEPAAIPASLRVAFIGDPPHLAGVAWITDGEGSVTLSPVQFPDVIPEEAYAEVKDYYGNLTIEQVLAVRSEWAHASPASSHRHRMAHRHLLVMEVGSMLASPSLERDCNRVWQVLVHSFWRRAQVYLAHRQTLESREPLDPARDEVHRSQARIGEEMYEWLRWDAGPDKRMRLNDLRQTFGMFACGKSNAFQCYGAPNGANMFCFPELALLLCDPEHGYEHAGGSGFWFDMAIIWSAMTEMAANCYRSTQYKVCSYKPAHNPIARHTDGLATVPVRPTRTYTRRQQRQFFRRWQKVAGMRGPRFQRLLAGTAEEREEAIRALDALRLALGHLVLSALGDEFDAPRTGLLELKHADA